MTFITFTPLFFSHLYQFLFFIYLFYHTHLKYLGKKIIKFNFFVISYNIPTFLKGLNWRCHPPRADSSTSLIIEPTLSTSPQVPESFVADTAETYFPFCFFSLFPFRRWHLQRGERVTESSPLCVMECFDSEADWLIICAITQLNYECWGLASHLRCPSVGHLWTPSIFLFHASFPFLPPPTSFVFEPGDVAKTAEGCHPSATHQSVSFLRLFWVEDFFHSLSQRLRCSFEQRWSLPPSIRLRAVETSAELRRDGGTVATLESVFRPSSTCDTLTWWVKERVLIL